MANYNRLSHFVITISLVIVTANASSLDADDSIEFGYSGDKGSDKWGSLHPKFKACSDGKAQSPIDIPKDKKHNENLKPLGRDYKEANATLVNNGFNIGIHFEQSAGTMTVDGKNYSLLQIHWHTPSEHKMQGQLFDAELQIVHKADDGSISMGAILYKLGNADPVLAKIEEPLAELAKEKCGSDEHAQISIGSFCTKPLRRNNQRYYRYTGSFTAPPCTENVIWHVFSKVRYISKAQIDALKAPMEAAFKNNSRPVQPDNGRPVELYDVTRKN